MTMADPSGDVAPTIHDQDFWTRKMVYKVVYPSEAADAFKKAFAEGQDEAFDAPRRRMTFPTLFTSTPTAAGVLLTARSTGRSLFLLRSDDGYWGTPGGHVERGETPYVAMLRELEEETGRVVVDCELRRPVRVGGYVLFFATVPREFAPTLNEEHVDWRWCSETPTPLHPGAVRALRG